MRRQRTLAPLLRERWQTVWRGAGFGRPLLLRRVATVLLVGLAAVLALVPVTGSAAGVPVVVAARDLAPGTVLGAGEVLLRELPATAVPVGAAQVTAAVQGRTLAAPVRRGEPLTDLRLTGSALARAVSADPAAVSVPLRLPDPDIAALLHPGAVVDVVTLGPQGQPVVLASGARVLAVLEAATDTVAKEGRLVLVALDSTGATRVAAASLAHSVTVTVR
ncbi:MAG TPA: SAF domain-containing protein [Pseudonocardiaceae bacterium]|jgi:Flp pilus assembly protein CpaB|nr:SAF domain-containing protein [Pseudonocardiaceae bacterium]